VKQVNTVDLIVQYIYIHFNTSIYIAEHRKSLPQSTLYDHLL